MLFWIWFRKFNLFFSWFRQKCSPCSSQVEVNISEGLSFVKQPTLAHSPILPPGDRMGAQYAESGFRSDCCGVWFLMQSGDQLVLVSLYFQIDLV